MAQNHTTKYRTANARLDETQVRAIRRRGAERMIARVIAEEFDVGTETVRKILRGDSWGWLEWMPNEIQPKGVTGQMATPVYSLPRDPDERLAARLAAEEYERIKVSLRPKERIPAAQYDAMQRLGLDVSTKERGD